MGAVSDGNRCWISPSCGGGAFPAGSDGDIRLQGNEAVTKEDILFDGDIREPVNVFQISTSQLQERLKKDVRIADAEVSRAFLFILM